MDKKSYINACEMTEHKDRPARLRHLVSGEIGTVVQCTDVDTPEAFLVEVNGEFISWSPDEVEEVDE